MEVHESWEDYKQGRDTPLGLSEKLLGSRPFPKTVKWISINVLNVHSNWVMPVLFQNPRTNLYRVPKGFRQWRVPGYLIHNLTLMMWRCGPDAVLWIQSSPRRLPGTCSMLALAKYQTNTQTKDTHL